jgi:hypothetical protein
VIVGYTANYGVYVHENTEARHGADYNAWYGEEISQGLTKSGKLKKGWKGKTSRGPEQQSKFLERPARRLNNDGTLSQIVLEQTKAGVKLQPAVKAAAVVILAESQRICPVDTGNLRASGFVREE